MRYKGKLLFEITRKGIWFPYRGDEILRFWPSVFNSEAVWRKKYKYSSMHLDQAFTSIKEYNEIIEKTKASLGKIEGFQFSEIVNTWMKVHLRHGYFVVLYDINVSSKSTDFWLRIPSASKKELVKDVVVLRCKSKKEAKDLCTSIPLDFASAVGIDHGAIIEVNED